jgi:hypothetical protein
MLRRKSPKYSGGPNLRAYLAIPGPISDIPMMPRVPAMKEPTAAIHKAWPPRPFFVMANPSQVVATDAASPGILTRMLVVEPPYMAPYARPASMIIDPMGLRYMVMGRSMARVAAGPSPGRTPTNVPRVQPTKQ